MHHPLRQFMIVAFGITTTYGLGDEERGIWQFRRASGGSLDDREGYAGSSCRSLVVGFRRPARSRRAPSADGWCRRR